MDAVMKQMRTISFAHMLTYTSDVAESLAEVLVGDSGGAFSHVMYATSGSEAVESAIKLARQYHISKGDEGRTEYISRFEAYHGNTLGALSAGYMKSRRKPFEGMLCPGYHHVSAYSPSEQEVLDVTEYVHRLLQEMENMFHSIGPERVAAVLIEPVSGATLGCVPATSAYLAGVRRLCNKYGALLIYDEVMCGMGRVGTTHAWQSLGGCAPDIQTIGKGLAGGYQPLSAVLTVPKIHQIMRDFDAGASFVHGHTYQGHGLGCAAALAVQAFIRDHHLLENVRTQGVLLGSLLHRLDSHPHVANVRGIGLFFGVQFVEDKIANRPFDHPINTRVIKECFDVGLAVYPCSSVDAILFAPPFIVNSEEITTMVNIFTGVLGNIAQL